MSNLSEGWKIARLDEIANINPKKMPKPSSGKVSFIPMDAVSASAKLIRTEIKEYDEVAKGFTSFRDLDVIVAKITPCFENGKGAFLSSLENGIGFGSTEFHVLRAKNNSVPEFIYYLTTTREFRGRGELNMQGSAGQKRVTTDYLKSYKIPLPPLPEQRKIAQILSTWDNAIATTEKQIANSKQQKKALMQQLLTGKKRLAGFSGDWEVVKLSQVAKISIGLVTTMTKHYVESGVPLIRNSDIKPNEINKDKMIFLSDSFATENEHRKLKLKDIVTVHTGDVGVSAVIDKSMVGSLGFATLNTRPVLKKIHPEYLCWFFNSHNFIHWCISMSTGDGRQNLNLKDFVKARIPLPPLKEQQKIAQVLTTADNEISTLETQLSHLQQEKKALMQQLLTGKRRVVVAES